jgi:hypothetical protein
MTIHQEPEAGFIQNASGLLVPALANQVLGTGHYRGEIVRDGKVIDEFEFKNLVVNQGLNYLLGAGLAGGAQITTWYIGLFSGNYTVLAADTASVIATNSTEVTAYSGGARPTWVANSSSPTGQSTSNSSSQASFTFTGPVTVFGAFLISSATISGTGGTLFSGAQFGASKSVVSSDVLNLTYTYTAASA